MKCLDKKRIKLRHGEDLVFNERNILTQVQWTCGHNAVMCLCRVCMNTLPERDRCNMFNLRSVVGTFQLFTNVNQI